MKYLLLMQVNPDVLENLSEADREKIGPGHEKFMESTKQSGEFILTQALADPTQSAVVRGTGGAPAVTVGPFAEAKEFMGGFYLVDVASHERALELAQQIPDAGIEGLAIEVRPVMFSAGADL